MITVNKSDQNHKFGQIVEMIGHKKRAFNYLEALS
jgi:hypothetical protein